MTVSPFENLIYCTWVMLTLASCCASKEEYYAAGGKSIPMLKYRYDVNILNNKKCGEFIWFSESGDTIQYSNYKNNMLNGLSKYYFENNILQLKVECKQDERDGLTIEYYKNGKVFIECIYQKNRLWEVRSVYDSLGNRLDFGHLMNGNGTVTNYYPDGTVRQRGKFKDGYRHGQWYFFSNTGHLLESTIYDNGYALDAIVRDSHY